MCYDIDKYSNPKLCCNLNFMDLRGIFIGNFAFLAHHFSNFIVYPTCPICKLVHINLFSLHSFSLLRWNWGCSSRCWDKFWHFCRPTRIREESNSRSLCWCQINLGHWQNSRVSGMSALLISAHNKPGIINYSYLV